MALAVVLYSFHHRCFYFMNITYIVCFPLFLLKEKVKQKVQGKSKCTAAFAGPTHAPKPPKGGFSDSLDFGFALR